jgi:hypothetical protein
MKFCQQTRNKGGIYLVAFAPSRQRTPSRMVTRKFHIQSAMLRQMHGKQHKPRHRCEYWAWNHREWMFISKRIGSTGTKRSCPADHLRTMDKQSTSDAASVRQMHQMHRILINKSRSFATVSRCKRLTKRPIHT